MPPQARAVAGPQPIVHTPYWYEGFDPSSLAGKPAIAPLFSHSPYTWPGLDVSPLSPCADEFDQSSDKSAGYSDSEGSDRESESRSRAKEDQLLQCILGYFKGCLGSLPSERVQNILKKDHAELYEAVVATRFRKKWHKFLQHHADTFDLFTRPAQPEPDQDYSWRIRLVGNDFWEEADKLEDQERGKRDDALVKKVSEILSGRPNQLSTMVEVLNELNKDVEANGAAPEGDGASPRSAPKVRAGDLKRLVKKRHTGLAIVEPMSDDGQLRGTVIKLAAPLAPRNGLGHELSHRQG